MAWLQNLTGQAEKFLNKIDQKAANVLNETNPKPRSSPQHLLEHSISIPETYNSFENDLLIDNSPFEHSKLTLEFQETTNQDVVDKLEEPEENPTDEVHSKETEVLLEGREKNSSVSSKCESVLQSFSSAEDIQRYLERISKLEFENDDLSKQLLNVQHLYSEIRNENSILKSNLERANEAVNSAEMEMEQYKARAHRILQEKERIICLKPGDTALDNVEENIYRSYNEELKNELKFQKDKNDEMKDKIGSLVSELKSLQQQYVVMQNMLQQTNQKLETELYNERRVLKSVDEELRLKSQELNNMNQELVRKNYDLSVKNEEIEQLKSHLKQCSSAVNDEELEDRIKNLTQTLMIKQNKIEAITSERNALRIQLEKLENEYHRNLAIARSIQQKVVSVNDTDDVKLQVPQTVRVSPLDAGVTRRVKHAYSSLDALSIRTGVFLRRYPGIRVSVFCYMIFLHLWVLVILFNYAPSTRGDCL
ncbi:golgin-84 [Coccinella septempunctata]|uniref:golgin-84 n=1 Tax=Coccinella septempunctata TaxID=41139 RepID=UPI001D096AB7|nr:golgin-84 [Coccinella septempunctata]